MYCSHKSNNKGCIKFGVISEGWKFKTHMEFKEFVAYLKSQLSIEEYVSRYGVTLTSSGYRLKGLCPFHNEKTPSFIVDTNMQSYKCYGCGAYGDVISFVTEKDGTTFVETIQALAEENNIEIPQNVFKRTIDNGVPQVDIQTVRRCLQETGNFFYFRFKNLNPAHPAKQEVTRRALPTDNKNFLYGYAPESWDALYQHLKERGFSDETMLQAGVIIERSTGRGFIDRWRNRLMFFICDLQGRIIGFTGRALAENDMPKYSNSPETALFKKSKALYSINTAKDSMRSLKQVFVAEGQFDVMALRYAQVNNTVASSGTAFTPTQAHTLSRMVEDGTIVFCFDGDNAGIKAVKHVFTTIPEIHDRALVVALPANSDPCDFLKTHGAKALHDYVHTNQTPIVQFLLNLLKEEHDISHAQGRGAFTRHAVKMLAFIRNPVVLKHAVREVALWSLTTMRDIEKLLEEERTTTPHKAHNNDRTPEEQRNTYELMGKTSEADLEKERALVELVQGTNDLRVKAAVKALSVYMRAGGKGIELPPVKLIPKPLRDTYTTIAKNDTGVFYPEMFTHSTLVEYLLSDLCMPLTPNMPHDDLVQHYTFLRDFLQKVSEEQYVRNVHAQTYRTLDEGATLQDLQTARKLEKERLLSVGAPVT